MHGNVTEQSIMRLQEGWVCGLAMHGAQSTKQTCTAVCQIRR